MKTVPNFNGYRPVQSEIRGKILVSGKENNVLNAPMVLFGSIQGAGIVVRTSLVVVVKTTVATRLIVSYSQLELTS